jgi:hypothetical protein
MDLKLEEFEIPSVEDQKSVKLSLVKELFNNSNIGNSNDINKNCWYWFKMNRDAYKMTVDSF